MRGLLLALLILLGAGPALAQSASDPVGTVRAFYGAPSTDDLRFYAKALRALYERDQREAAGEVGRIGFDFRVNGQDTAKGWEKTLRLATLSAGEDRAEVQATFRNGRPQDIRYDLVREGGRWLIADVRAVTGERWGLVALLSQPLN